MKSHAPVSALAFFFVSFPLLFTGDASCKHASLKSDILKILHNTKDLGFTVDESLENAAAAAAKRILSGSCAAACDRDEARDAVFSALRDEAVTDRTVYPVALVSEGPIDLLHLFSGFLDERGADKIDGKTVGLEAFTTGDRSVCVLICVDRIIRLANTPGHIPQPSMYLLEGSLVKSAGNLEVVVQTPDLEFLKPTIKIKGNDFSVILPLNGSEGRYRCEILGDLGYGPSVLNLFDIDVGSAESPGRELNVTEAGAAADKAKNRAWALFHSINSLRQSLGLASMKAGSPLSQCALGHCRDMKENSFFGHTSPSEGSLEKRMKKLGIHSPFAAEVMTVAGTPRRALENLASSPSHLAALLDGACTHMGVAVVKTQEGYLFTAVMAAL